ncbi:hypothetical protein OIM90_12180 [Streptomyces sp. AD16]|nr:hypothetical protein OIM90_12180 [Streptomyces sp. AD16]
MPSLFGGRRRLPGSLQGELGDMQGSMKRRVKQMEGLAELERLGYPVRDGSVFLDEKPPDAERIDAARRHFQDLRTTDFGTNGNRDDLERIAAELDGLTAAELDVFFSKSSPRSSRSTTNCSPTPVTPAGTRSTGTACPRPNAGRR